MLFITYTMPTPAQNSHPVPRLDITKSSILSPSKSPTVVALPNPLLPRLSRPTLCSYLLLKFSIILYIVEFPSLISFILVGYVCVEFIIYTYP